jgi:hypothetical protein
MLTEISIEVQSLDRSLMFDLFGVKKVESFKTERTISKGISIKCGLLRIQETVAPEVIELILVITEKVGLAMALNIASNWVYDKIKDRKVSKLKVGGVEVPTDKDKIKERMLVSAKPKLYENFMVRLSFPDFSKDEVERAARTLAFRPIEIDGNELPYPENQTLFSEYVAGYVEVKVRLTDKNIIKLYENGKSLYATPQINKDHLPLLFFTKLILSLNITSCLGETLQRL